MKFTLARGTRVYAVACGAAIVFLSGCSRTREITQMGCTAPPEVEAAWKRLADAPRECYFRYACWQGKIDAAKKLRSRFPQELLAHRVLVESVKWTPRDLPRRDSQIESLRKEYRELSKRYPKNPSYPFLLAQLGANKQERPRLLHEALSRDSGFVWAHKELAGGGTEEARKHLDFFARNCPAKTSELLNLLFRLKSREVWLEYAPALRNAARPETGKFEDLPALWELEFQYADTTAYPSLTKEVARQVAELRALNRPSDEEWLGVLETGYRLAGDETGQQWVGDQRLSRFPCTWGATSVRFKRYQKEHGGAPGDEAALKEWNKRYRVAFEEWLRQCPDDYLLLQERLDLLRADEAPDPKQVELAGEKALDIVGPFVSAQVAGLYIDKRVRLDSVDALLNAYKRSVDIEWKDAEAAGLDAEDLATMRGNHLSHACAYQQLRVRLALALKDQRRAERELVKLDQSISEIEKSTVRPDVRKRVAFWKAKAWSLRAEKEILAGRNEPALAAYSKAIELNPDDRKLIKAAEALYPQVHGSAEGFAAWRQELEVRARIASEEVARAVRRPMPPIDLPDLSGKKWTSSDLEGKAVLVNIWATWCGPCQGELPHIQKLYESWKGNRSFGIVTISVDENPGLIEPYMKERKYTFPVLIAGAGSFRAWAPHGIPLNYIVNPDGMIVQEQSGFGGGGDLWEKKIEGYLAAALVAEKK
jgi:thiol-disulfide isomerase/thioredoxin